jgi:hypothetical protein
MGESQWNILHNSIKRTNMKTTIRASKHIFVKNINTGKRENLIVFLIECNRVLQIMINYIWNDGISWSVINKKTGITTIKICCPKHGYYDIAKYFDYNLLKIDTTLSARALSSITSIAMGMISSAVKKHCKIRSKNKKELTTKTNI